MNNNAIYKIDEIIKNRIHNDGFGLKYQFERCLKDREFTNLNVGCDSKIVKEKIQGIIEILASNPIYSDLSIDYKMNKNNVSFIFNEFKKITLDYYKFVFDIIAIELVLEFKIDNEMWD